MNNSSSIKKKIILILFSTTSFIYIFWRIFFTLPIDNGLISLILGLVLVIAETIGVIEAFSNYRNLTSNSEPEMPQIPEEYYPDVDIFIATHSEPVDILYKTVNGCINMKYPNKDKVHIYICDDNNRFEMQILAKKMGVGYIGFTENKHAKAGNLNNAISKTKSPLIATFDADMIPRSNFLMETVPYFSLPYMKKNQDGIWIKKEKNEIDKNYKIGFIQTAQSFYNPDLFQYNLYSEQHIPSEQDYFFKKINIGRNRTNSPIYTGSNTVISRKAIEDIGGLDTNNITQDFATGINIQTKGYRCFAISKVLAHGLAPIDFKILLKQRQKWGKGCINPIKSLKSSYINCFLYWTTFIRRFIYIIAPILYSVFGVIIIKCNIRELIFIWLPSYILYNISLKYFSGNLRNQKWNNIIETIISPYLIMPIFNTELKYSAPHIILMIMTMYGIGCTIQQLFISGNLVNIVTLYWLALNLYSLIMAIFFMLSRVNVRKGERFYTKLDVKISFDNIILDATTNDISESGMSFILDSPEYIPYNKEIDINIKYMDYEADLKAIIVHIEQIEDKWKYGLKIVDISDCDKNKYYQIIYDRHHTLGTTIESNIVREIKSNIVERNKEQITSNRKLPRVALNYKISSDDGEELEILNFNYEYIGVKGRAETEKFDLVLNENLTLKCELYNVNTISKTTLYKISNIDEIINDKEAREVVLKWVKDKNISSSF